MTISENRNGPLIELIVQGRLDTNTAPELESKLKVLAPEAQTLYLNLSGIEYVSSAGLRVILLAHKLMLPTGGKMILKSPSSFCRQVLEATGMDGILTIE